MFYPDIQTPAVLIDLDIAEANIDRYQTYCTLHGLALRPHIKTHKLPSIAKRQLAAGAIGITCQKVSEAEAMISAGGIEDVLITYNILGQDKLDRLKALSKQVRLSVVADNKQTIDGLSKTFRDAVDRLPVLVECDTGAERCGVTSPEAACDLAKTIDQSPGLSFGGLMTYPPIGCEETVQNWLASAKDKIEAAGLSVPVISSGGSPGMWRAHDVAAVTEYRVGTYVYNDRSLQSQGLCSWADCALTVLATVVSVQSGDRAVIDAGSKVLTSDLLGLTGYGHVLRRPDIKIDGLSEEHGVLRANSIRLEVGDLVRIVPNHACVVSNMVDEVRLVRGDTNLGAVNVKARGKIQ